MVGEDKEKKQNKLKTLGDLILLRDKRYVCR